MKVSFKIAQKYIGQSVLVGIEMLLPELSMVDMLLLAMDTQRSYTLLYAWIRICFFPAMDTDILLPEIPMVDMLLLATDMEMYFG